MFHDSNMDVTPLFKACIKTVKTRNKAFGVQNDGDRNRILRSRPKTGFMSIAKDITSQITRLRDFLLENKRAYLSFYNHLSGDEMSESERDQLDGGAQRIIYTCSHLLKEFRHDSRKMGPTSQSQTREYMDAVIELIDSYLKAVCKIHSEMKAVRVKRALDMRKLAKLEIDNIEPYQKPINEDLESENTTTSKDNLNIPEKDLSNKKCLEMTEIETAILSDEDKLSAEELQMFESENVQLYNELNTLSDEVKQIESKVLHIAELQEIFTEKVLQQEQDIDRISTTVIGSTENVKDANEQIRQAIQRNAGLRVWVLFFLLVMSFSLLFLDWYND